MTRSSQTRIAVFFGLTFASTALPSELTLEAFLNQVKNQHDGAKATSMLSAAEQQRAVEADLPLAWTLNSSLEQRNDFQTPLSLFFLQSQSTTGQLGISKLTSFGLQSKWVLNTKFYQYIGIPAADAGLIPFTSYWDVSTGLELTQSLWRNGFGRSTRAQRNVDEATAMGNHFRNSYQVKQLMQQAETAYWAAAASQEIVSIQEENLDRATKLVEWSEKRTQLDLADKSDLLQAESSFKLRELDLAQGKGDLKTNSRALNSLRGVDSDALVEKLNSVFIDDLHTIKPPSRAKYRDDVLAAVQDSTVADGNAKLGAEKNKPTFEAYVNYYLTGRDPNAGAALNLIPRGTYTLGVFGVRLTMPLEFGLLSADKAAYLKEQRAAELNKTRKQFEQENDWHELTRKLGEAKERLHLARKIEKAQKEKWTFERQRLRQGKTTLFQVLQFETDLATSQLTRIQRETDVRTILTQMKTFGGNS